MSEYKVVPVELTPEMLKAAACSVTHPENLPPIGKGWSMNDLAFRTRYQAALAACPAVQGEPVEDALHTRALGLFKPPFRYDSHGGYIWDSENNMVAENHDLQNDAVLRVRGWGRISYMDDPEALQDKAGELIATALTAYWTQPVKHQTDVSGLVEALEKIADLHIDPCTTENDYRLSGAKSIAHAALAAYRKTEQEQSND